jgi:hypothetical protein
MSMLLTPDHQDIDVNVHRFPITGELTGKGIPDNGIFAADGDRLVAELNGTEIDFPTEECLHKGSFVFHFAAGMTVAEVFIG